MYTLPSLNDIHALFNHVCVFLLSRVNATDVCIIMESYENTYMGFAQAHGRKR